MPAPLRERPESEFYLQENEFIDIYAPLVGPFASMIFVTLCRRCYGRAEVEYSVRDLAQATGMSPTTAARSLQDLQTIGLIRVSSTGGNRTSICQLLDVKTLARSQGAKRERKGSRFVLPQSVADQLKSDLKALRRNQQRKRRAPANLGGNQPENISDDSYSAVSERDASVSHPIHQRATRETQTGPHLLQEEIGIEEDPSPTPSHMGDMKSPERLSNEDGPDALLKWARDRFNGVMDNMRSHLLDTNRPPHPNLANGADDWNEFGFNSLAVEAAEWRGETLELSLSARDPAAAQRGLAKYRQIFNDSLRSWYESEIKIVW